MRKEQEKRLKKQKDWEEKFLKKEKSRFRKAEVYFNEAMEILK